MTFTRIFVLERKFSCAWEGCTSSIFGGHKPQNTLQWHWACYFILERNPRLGAQFSLGGRGLQAVIWGFLRFCGQICVFWLVLRTSLGVLCFVYNFACCQATALQRFQEAHFRKPPRNIPTPETKFWPLLCISCSCPVIKAHRLRQTHIFLSQV